MRTVDLMPETRAAREKQRRKIEASSTRALGRRKIEKLTRVQLISLDCADQAESVAIVVNAGARLRQANINIAYYLRYYA